MYDVISMKSIAKSLNDLTYSDYFYRLTLIARSRFKWNNLPNNINEKWIERFLYYEGECLFFDDPEKGLMVAKCSQSRTLNHYDEPTELTPYGTGYSGTSLKNAEFDMEDGKCILIQNNDMCLPTYRTIQLYALRLADISRTADINVYAQRTPVLITCSERQKQTLKNVYKQWSGCEPVIYGEKNLTMEDFNVLKTDAPIVFDKLRQEKHAVWNECMTFLGINNANMDKRERLVDDEVQANNEQVEACAELMLKSRQRACELINELFKTNISVELRDIKPPTLEQVEGGIEE